MSRPALRAIPRQPLDEAESSGSRRRDPSVEIVLTPSVHPHELAKELPSLCVFAGYEILGRLAVGGMAEIFLARERGELGSVRHIALKVIRPQLAADAGFEEMFMREGKVALGLSHPNICHTYRFGLQDSHPFLAMELVSGMTVRELLERRAQPLAPPVAAKIVSNIAEALHSAHVAKDERGRALGIVHQDVSPHNVMVAHDGTVKLLDFGVASTTNERAAQGTETSHVTIRGKLGYLSPEQCTGAPIDPRSDVFSLGIVLYEMLTNKRLFVRPRRLETMRAIATEPLPPWPATIPPTLAKVLDRALAQKLADRYPSALAMQEDLERYLAEGRSVVTSARIAEILAQADDGGAGDIDTSQAAVAWLRAETVASAEQPTVAPPVVVAESPSRSRAPKRAIAVVALLALVGAILWVGATLGAWTSAAPDLSTVSAAPVTGAAPALEVPVAPIAAPVATPSPVSAVPTVSAEPVPAAPTAHARSATPSEAHAPVARPHAPARSPIRSASPRSAPAEGASRDFVEDPGF